MLTQKNPYWDCNIVWSDHWYPNLKHSISHLNSNAYSQTLQIWMSQWVLKILYNKLEKVDLPGTLSNYTHISAADQVNLLNLLTWYYKLLLALHIIWFISTIEYEHHQHYLLLSLHISFFQNLHFFALSYTSNWLPFMSAFNQCATPHIFLVWASTQAQQSLKFPAIISKLVESLSTVVAVIAQNTRNVDR